MANRRKFLAGIGALASGSAAAVGTGAFTSVEANRSVTISTAADNDALLQFTSNSNRNGEYASTDGNQATVDFSTLTTSKGATGVNEDSLTTIYDIFSVRNQGTQDVLVYVDPASLEDDNAFDKTTPNGLYLDPQFSDMPNSDDPSLKTLGNGEKYGSLTGIGGSVESFEQDLREDNSEVPYSPDTFILGPGDNFDLGLYIKTDGAVDDVEVGFEIIADATLAKLVNDDS
ncbi:hypothetical protein ACOZ35_15360 [Halorubrum xinjiangense]|uniref:hypothetical protein n=1 Tax=Halorubrum xinjiangense TaxID=261291 RepID=UPI003C6F1C1D